MNRTERQHPPNLFVQWGVNLPYLLPLVVLVTLAIIVYAGGLRILSTAEALAEEDAAILNWWQMAQREELNAQASLLAHQISDPSDLEPLAAKMSLVAPGGYVAWIDGEKNVRAAINSEAALGEPAELKLFAFTPAIGQASSDFMIENGRPYWISMAPVSPEKGGGVVVLQRPITEQTATALADLVGRDVLFYTYEDQAPFLSSDPGLVVDPPTLNRTWMTQVAAGQQPASTRATNRQGEQIVGMTAFRDFAAISYSGYLGVVEPAQRVSELLPSTLFWVAVLIATLFMAVGAFLLQRSVRSYLYNYRNLSPQARRSAKISMVALTFLFLAPTLLAAGYVIVGVGERSADLDRRTSQVAAGVLTHSADALTARVNQFAVDQTAQNLSADSLEALAEALRQAHSVEFVLVDTGEAQVQAGEEELNADSVAALQTIAPGQADVVQGGNITMLAAAQPGSDGTTAYAGLRLNKELRRIKDVSGADLTVVNERQPVFTTLAEREIETLYFDEAVEEELRQHGQASYLQKVGWNPGKLTLYGLSIAGADQWRLVISQASITWTNAMRAYQGLSLAALALALVIVGAVLMTLTNLDKPLLLRRLATGYFFILPALIWLVWWQLGPALFAVYLSFHKWSVLADAKPFVGLHNYRQIMQDDVFWNAMKNTFVYVTQIPIGMALALALALALNRPLKGIKTLRTIYYMPAVTSIVVVSLMWKLLYNKDLGIFNYLLEFLGLGPYGFLQSTTMALPSIMAMAIWLGLGARMILFLAGLQSISSDYYEAADVDGAGAWSKFWHITLPLLAPTTFFVFITSIIGSFQVFGPIYVLTQGGPAGASDVAVHRIYFEAWQNLRFGYASAETVVLFAFLFIITAIQFRYFGRNVSYG